MGTDDMRDQSVVIYEDDMPAIRESIPGFLKREFSIRDIDGGFSIQWPGAWAAERKRDFLRSVIGSLVRDGDALALVRTGWRSRRELTAEQFVESVDNDFWWLGDIALLIPRDSGLRCVLYPGSDGDFLHVVCVGEPVQHVRALLMEVVPDSVWEEQ